jgi:hypothetical protein
MFGKREWNNTPGDSQFNAYWTPEGWCYEHNNDLLPDLVQRELIKAPRNEVATFTVDWLSSGYYDPGVSTGPVEKSYPPEGDDERALANVVTVEIGNATAKLSKEASIELFDDVLETIIMKTDPDEYDAGGREHEPNDYYESYFIKTLDKILFDS